MSCCQARDRRSSALGGRLEAWRIICLDFAISEARSRRSCSFSAMMLSNLYLVCLACAMVACIVFCVGFGDEQRSEASLAAMVFGPSEFAGVRSSLCVVSSVAIGGSSVTPAMDVFEYSHRRRQLWRSGLEILFRSWETLVILS